MFITVWLQYYFRVIVELVVGIYDLVIEKSCYCLLNCFDLVISYDLLLQPFSLQFELKEKVLIYIWLIIYINNSNKYNGEYIYIKNVLRGSLQEFFLSTPWGTCNRSIYTNCSPVPAADTTVREKDYSRHPARELKHDIYNKDAGNYIYSY
jgi:hypothetical protein